MRYDQLYALIDEIKPRTIIEIGTHNAKRAIPMCRQALCHGPVQYIGYDLFEAATEETNACEHNGKGRATFQAAHYKLQTLAKRADFRFELIVGDTRETLHGQNLIADFVFVDGGHSVETIRGDYEAVKGSKCIVFDDYYPAGADTAQFGCNEILNGIAHRLLPKIDHFGPLMVQLAVTP